MNERIESYLKQHFCRDYFNSYGDSVEDEHYFMYREEVDGLIELIVRECMLCSDSLAKHYINTHPEKEQVWLLAAIADYSNEIEKHFGVKNETQ